MIGRLRSRWTLFGVTILVVFLGALVQLRSAGWLQVGGSDGAVAADTVGANRDPATLALNTTDGVADAVPSPSPSNRQSVAVRRGPIAELLALSGRIAGADEVGVSFPSLVRVESVAIVPGQTVEEGQVLLKADSEQIVKDLEAARARVEVSTIRLSQAEAQAQARQREADRRVEGERTRQLAVVGDAEGGLRRAQADYERVRAGAPVSDRQAAEASVISARAAVVRAEADLARTTKPSGEIEVRAADQQVWSARLALQRAQEELERLRRGADPTERRLAERDVANAELAVLRATSDLERVSRGPDPTLASTASRDLQRAELALRVAQASKSGKDKSERLAHDASVRSAELSVQDARERLARLNVAPPSGEIETARRGLAAARESLDIARERLQVVARGPDSNTLAAANQAVESAQTAVATAETRYLELQAGPSADQVTVARQSVESARTSLASALSRQSEVNSHPTRAELQEAGDRVAAAQAAVERSQVEAQQDPQPVADTADPASFDMILLERSVEQDRAAVQNLERSLTATRLTAPFTGVVAAVHVQAGDPLEPGRAAVTLARPGAPIVRIDLDDKQLSRLAPGQQATVQIEGIASRQFDAFVQAIDSATGTTPAARLNADWMTEVPAFGASVQTSVTLQRKDDVLIVPQRAIRTLGQRRFVEVLDGTSRRNVDVQVGIVQGGDAEIVSGLSEGQLVVVGP